MSNSSPPSSAGRGFDYRLFLRLYRFCQPHAGKRRLVLWTSFIRAFQRPLFFFAVAAIIKGPVAAGNYPGTVFWTGAFFILILSTAFVLHLRSKNQNELGDLLVHDLRNALFSHLQNQTLSYYHRTKPGRILSRTVTDLESVRHGVQLAVFIAQEFVQLAFCALLMLYFNWVLFLVILTFAPFLIWSNFYFHPRIHQFTRLVAESSSRLTGCLAESIRGMRVIQGFTRQKRGAEAFGFHVDRLSSDNVRLASFSQLYTPLLALTGQVFTAALLLIVGYGVFHLAPGRKMDSLVAFFFLPTSFFTSVQAAASYYPGILASQVGAERIFEVLDQRPAWEDAPGAGNLPNLRFNSSTKVPAARVEFRSVDFAYEPARLVLQDISFVAEPGQTIALVGHTGSGKSTIINLIAKFYLPTCGEIFIDHHEIRTLRSRSLRQQLGPVLQTNFLFNGTVLDNIRMVKPEASDADIYEAARRLDCYDLLQQLPQGFSTPVGEDGAGLSHGQRQLICFTRALLVNPRILLLDEATSSVDAATETRLQAALGYLFAGRTSFIVAHRLSTIARADQILVVNQGHIIERGSHPLLLSRDGPYRRLYRQFALAAG